MAFVIRDDLILRIKGRDIVPANKLCFHDYGQERVIFSCNSKKKSWKVIKTKKY